MLNYIQDKLIGQLSLIQTNHIIYQIRSELDQSPNRSKSCFKIPEKLNKSDEFSTNDQISIIYNNYYF